MPTFGVVAASLAGAAVGLLGLAPLAAAGTRMGADQSDWFAAREEAITRVAGELGVTDEVLEAAAREVIATNLEEVAADVRAGTEERVSPDQWLDGHFRQSRVEERRAEFARDLAAELGLEPEQVAQVLEGLRRDGYQSWGERLGQLVRERLGR